MNTDYFDGSIRPNLIPDNWEGRPLKQGKNGWCWYNPDSRLDAVFLYKDTQTVIAVSGGVCLDRNGKPIAGSPMPDD